MAHNSKRCLSEDCQFSLSIRVAAVPAEVLLLSTYATYGKHGMKQSYKYIGKLGRPVIKLKALTMSFCTQEC